MLDPPTKEGNDHSNKISKNEQSAWHIDGIQAELLKVDLTSATEIMFKLFNTIWTNSDIPFDLSKGLIKLPKKDDLENCDNWRFITLLPIPSKYY